MNLWRVAIDESTGKTRARPEAITTPSTFSGYISIARNGNLIVYSQETHTIHIERAVFDSVREEIIGKPTAITESSRELISPDVSPDGVSLVFASRGTQEDIWISAANGTSPRQLTDDTYRDRLPRWSPDGSRIAFYSNRSGDWQLWSIRPDGGGLQQLTYAKPGNVFYPAWSPDGNRLVCNLVGHAPFIIMMDKSWREQTPEVLPLPDGDAEFLASSWSPDGRKLVGWSRQVQSGHSSNPFFYDITLRKYESLGGSGTSARWLHDSRRLVYISFDKMWLIDTHSRRVRELLSVAPGYFYTVSLSPDNKLIYFGQAATEADIWLLTLG
jgi:Tol biopolymer transport system component